MCNQRIAGLFLLGYTVFASTQLALAQTSSYEKSELARASRLNEEVFRLWKLEKYQEAIGPAKEALEIRRRIKGENDRLVAHSLLNLAAQYDGLRRYAEAEPLYLRSLRIRERVLGPEALETAVTLNNLGTTYTDLRKFDLAEKTHLRALSIRTKKLGEFHADTARTLNNLAFTYSKQDKFGPAKDYYERALKVNSQLFGADSLEVGSNHHGLAFCLQELGMHREAESHFLQALSIRERKLGRLHRDTGTTMRYLGSLYQDQGRLDEANTYLASALQAMEKSLGPSHELTGLTLNGLALVREQQGQYDEAAPLLRRALGILRKEYGEEHTETATTMANLAIVIEIQGDYAEADSLERRALEIRKKILGPDHLDTATSLNSVGCRKVQLGEYAAAEDLFQQVVQIREKIRGTNHSEVAHALLNLAVVKHRLGKTVEARAFAQRALAINRQAFGTEHPEMASALQLLGTSDEAEADLDSAEENLRQALQIAEKCFGENHPRVSQCLNLLARIAGRQGRVSEAISLLLRSSSIYESTLGESHPDSVTLCNNVALAYVHAGESDKAALYFDRNRRLEIAYLTQMLPSVSKMSQAVFLKQGGGAFEAAVTFAVQNSDVESLRRLSAEWLINSKSVAQRAFASRNAAANPDHGNQVNAKLERLRKLRSRQAELAMFASNETPIEHQKRLDRIAEEVAALSTDLVASGYIAQSDDHWVDANAASAALSPHEVFIDLVRFREHPLAEPGSDWKAVRYAAWITRSNGQIEIIDLGLADEIDGLINRVLTQLKQDVHLLAEEGEEARTRAMQKELWLLSEKIWQPIAERVQGADHLIICPDGQLWVIPWSALMANPDGTYLLEKYNLRFVTSGRDLITLDSQELTARPALFADPFFDQDAVEKRRSIEAVFKTPPGINSMVSNGERLLPKVSALPNTALEASAILPSIEKLDKKPPTIYQGGYALEYVAKRLESPSIVTFSTHGFFLPDQEVDGEDLSSSADSRFRTVPKNKNGRPIENPLLRCGLLLSGCNNLDAIVSDDDGILTGQEITGINLQGTRLVVLSACETGIGDVHNGEGVSGLRQSFQLAGAQSVLASLWQVADAETAQLINLFFEQLSGGVTKSEALRQAQLKRIASRRERYGAAHPFFWAAFTLTGQD